ncbi:MAG: recombinase family protein [Actinomycetota bacterium]|nr:recombinase family protein [Actinomycetota bacterium]
MTGRAIGYVHHASRASASHHQAALLGAYATEHGMVLEGILVDVGPPLLGRRSSRTPSGLDEVLVLLGAGAAEVMLITSLRVLGRDPYRLLGIVDRADAEGWELLVIADWCRRLGGPAAPRR